MARSKKPPEPDPCDLPVNLSILRARIVDEMKAGVTELPVRSLLYMILAITKETDNAND